MTGLFYFKLSWKTKSSYGRVVNRGVVVPSRQFSWVKVLSDAKEKDGGVEPMSIAEILATFPREMVSIVKWTTPPDADLFLEDLRRISVDLLSGRENVPSAQGS